ncbi:MAG: ATP phosphoribosyltransferase [Candidatus Peribacteraceae bacterium]
MLQFAIPKKSSLSAPLRRFLAIAGYGLPEGDIEYTEANGVCFTEAGRRSIPTLIARGVFHVGITGYDLYLNAGESLRSVAELCFSRSSMQPTRWVLACRQGTVFDRGPLRVATELPRLAQRLLDEAQVPFPYTIEEIDGTEELCVQAGLADAVLTVTETGASLRRYGLRLVPGCEELLVSTPRIFARERLDPDQEEVLQHLAIALKSVVEAQGKVMVSFDIDELHLAHLTLDCAVAPTVSPLGKRRWVAVQICIPRTSYGCMLQRIMRAGGRSIVMQNIHGYMD